MEEIIKTLNPSQVFQALLSRDENLQPSNLTKTRTFSFNSEVEINDLSDATNVTVKHPMFIWPPDDGFRSVARRGYYRIVSPITEREDVNFVTGHKFQSYSAQVLFSKNLDSIVYYKFTANVGPLVNGSAVIFDLSPERQSKVLAFPDLKRLNTNKLIFLNNLTNKPFYVSLQQRINNSYKQTFWFRL